MVEVPQESLRRWTAAEVRRMVEAGVVENPERFELIDGLILEKMSRNEPHAVAISLALEALRLVYAEIAQVKAGVPIYLSETGEPEPDLMVVTSGLRRAIRAEDVRLVVEVANTSLRKDRTVKAALYARHRIPEYLLIDLVNRRVEIRRKPTGEDWGETLTLDERGEFTPIGANAPLRVADLLPDPELA